MNDALPKVHKPLLTVEVPKPYGSNKMVFRNYNCNYTHETSVDDLTGVGNMTRTGRFYGHDKVAQEKLLTPADKERPSKEIEEGTSLRDANKPLTKKEASEFLKFVKHSEYSIVE